MPIRLATIGLSALLAVSLSAHAQEKSYSPPQRPFLEDFTAPADVSRGTVSEIFVGPEAHERTGAPQSVCPPDGNPDAEAFAAWFTGWSLQGMGGYAMANNPASFKPAHQATVPAGEGAQFPVGSSDPEGPFPSIVKRVALCAHAAPSDIGDEEVFVHLTRIGLTPAACPGGTGFCDSIPFETSAPNMLVTWTSINDVQANFSWSVFAPEAHSVDVLIGGRIGTYPSIAAPGGSSPGLTPP